ncbi:hypothetical protein Hydth_0517 [Hydrogenobacter thermophilus TK-6]|uniref:Uncharacterized protein n=1 Tax=Hydrogenobacter thermophilus (strain DSM 6534 / IAM 12695 / TK-6) TaxID=608538 RepID=D3DGN1_HYDTT|nr:hypothetical protein Hydth_0517 [Hydrogenobacter thermophilus TK-6]BAI68983.1 hypothetical protein HTH_0519 [Hydrogenobacter thermophilus TK-6]
MSAKEEFERTWEEVNYPASKMQGFGWVYTLFWVPYHHRRVHTAPTPTLPKAEIPLGRWSYFQPLHLSTPPLKSLNPFSGTVGHLSYLLIYSTTALLSTPSGRAVSPHHRYKVLARKFPIKR